MKRGQWRRKLELITAGEWLVNELINLPKFVIASRMNMRRNEDNCKSGSHPATKEVRVLSERKQKDLKKSP
jgi:hypothetical protein